MDFPARITLTVLCVLRIILPPSLGAQRGGIDLTQTDLDIKLLRRGLGDRLVGCEVIHFESVGSTMDETRGLAERDGTEGTVVIAEEQTAGRGRFNRTWISPRGQNLSFSVLLRPTAEQLPFLNMAATLAVCRAVGEITGLEPTIKWPNDVRVNGLKVSGILIETAMERGTASYAVVGIGVNVNFDPSEYPEIAPFATSIFRETGRRTDRTTVLKLLLEHFDDLYRTVKEGRSLTEQWASKLETLGRTVQVRWRDRVLEGLAREIDDRGNLVLERPDGSTVTALAGEVTLQS